MDNTPAVLSLGKVCEDHRYHISGPMVQEPCLKKWCSDSMQHGELRSARGPRSIYDFLFTELISNSNIITAGK